MSPENKQRIVGVIVLIAFIALLIPFLFTNGVKKRQQLATGGEPMPVQVADVSSSPDKSPAMGFEQQAAALSGGSENAAEKVPPDNLPQKSTAVVNSFNGDQALSAEAALSQNVVASTPVVTDVKAEAATLKAENKGEAAESVPAKQPEETLKVQKSMVKSKPVVKSKAKSVAKISAMFWSVQVGSFSDQPLMQKMVANLQAKGFLVYLQKINTSHGLMVRVLVGREISKAKAIKIAEQLKTTLKINGHIVGNKK